MAWGKSNEQWNHTASLMTLLASLHSDPDSNQRPSLATFHPYMELPEIPEAPPELLAALFARSAGVKRKAEVPNG